MATNSVVSAELGGELAHAFARTGWTPNEVKELTSGDTLAEYLAVRRGERRTVEVEKPPAPPLFRYLDTVKIVATPSFDVSAHFKIGETDGVKVKLVDDLFTARFHGLVEEPQPALTLRRNELSRSASPYDIDEAFGVGIEEATCGQIWAFMKKPSRRGRMGKIFRACDKYDIRWLVLVYWSDEGLYVHLLKPSQNTGAWQAGVYEVLSRNS